MTRGSHAPVAWSADGRRLMTSTYDSASSGSIGVIDVETAASVASCRGISRDGGSILAWVVGSAPPDGDLVRVRWGGTRTILVRDADQRADWNA